MAISCTSCGVQIQTTTVTKIYKCQQCVNHIVCTSCYRSEHNVSSSVHHTMVKVESVSQLFSSNALAVVPKFAGSTYGASSKIIKSSIFTSRDYLTRFMSYCNYCLKVIVAGRDDLFSCDQCSTGCYNVCRQCVPLMVTHHQTTHTFTKTVSRVELLQLSRGLSHVDSRCGSCLQTGFRGIRYRCKTREVTCDYCETCIEKTVKHRALKIIPHPFLLATNKYFLARRAIKVMESYSSYRDSLTGWTRPYAESILSKSVREQLAYRKQLTSLMSTREAQGNFETDSTWQTAKSGLDTITQLGDHHIISDDSP